MAEKAAKAPAYQWYPKDAETDEAYRLMTCEELGVYERLRDCQWLEGSLPADLGMLAVLIGHRMTVRRLQFIWPHIAPCFPDDGSGRLANRKLEEQRVELAAYIASKKLAGRAGGLAKGKQTGSTTTILPVAKPSSASATASASAVEHERSPAREAVPFDGEAFMDAFRAGWKTLYGFECSLILDAIRTAQLRQQLAAIPTDRLSDALRAFFATADPYVLKAKHPIGLFLRDPLRFLATPITAAAAVDDGVDRVRALLKEAR